MKETISTLLSTRKICPTIIGHKKAMNNVEFEMEQTFLQEDIAIEDAEFEKQQAILQDEMAMEVAEFEKQQNLLSYTLENELSYSLGVISKFSCNIFKKNNI